MLHTEKTGIPLVYRLPEIMQKVINQGADRIQSDSQKELNMHNRSSPMPDGMIETREFPVSKPSPVGTEHCKKQTRQYHPANQRMQSQQGYIHAIIRYRLRVLANKRKIRCGSNPLRVKNGSIISKKTKNCHFSSKLIPLLWLVLLDFLPIYITRLNHMPDKIPLLRATASLIVSFFIVGMPSVSVGKQDSTHTKPYLPDHPGIAPYPVVSGGAFTGKPVSASPDPLVSYVWTRESEELQVYHLKPVKVSTETTPSFANVESALTDDCFIKVNGEGSIRFDFGVESAAWIEFDSPDLSGEVQMSVSEYNQPAVVNSGPQSPHKTGVPVKHGNTYRLELNAELYEGVRFGWIHVTRFDKPWHIKNIRLVCQTKPVNYAGHFESSDTLLNRIWYTGAYAVKLNLLKDHMGAILVDRGDRHSWTGDAHISQGVSMVAFGNYDMVKHNLQRTSVDNNSIESYSLLWIHSLLDYYYYSGDEAFLRSHLATLKRKIDHAAQITVDEINLGFYGWDERLGAGFETPNNPENRHAYRLLYVQTCVALSKALATLGEKGLSADYRQLADAKLQEIRKDPSWFGAIGLHAAAEAVNGGYLTEDESKALVNKHFLDTANIISFSPFNQYFIIRALANSGLHQEALVAINRTWGGQLRLGATTFWECFRPEWANVIQPNDPVPNGQHGYTSLCHPWSSGATRWLSEEILGIKPVSPGFKRFQVIPHLSNTLGAVRGDVPTPLGTIQFDIDVNQGVAHLRSPSGSLATVGIPKMGKQIRRISVNGQDVYPNRDGQDPSYANPTEDDGFVYLPDLPPGTYRIAMEYGGRGTKHPSPDLKKRIDNAVRLVSVDSTTTTDWMAHYGQDGYLLFDHPDTAVNEGTLPGYIEKIAWKSEGTGAPRLGNWQMKDGRSLAILATQNPMACYQTYYIDIMAQPEKAYQVTLRTAELGTNGKFVIDLFDQRTKNLIHPTVLVKTSGKARYYTFAAKGPIRIRLSHVEGEDAGISGIFFQ